MKNIAIVLIVSIFACKKQDGATQINLPNTTTSEKIQSWIVGDTTDVASTAQAGILLAGGSTDVDEAMRWLLKKANGGDVVIIRSSGADGYNSYLFKDLGININSCETFLVDTKLKASNQNLIRRIRGAEALFIAGGDQANYVNFWKGTPLNEAINYLINEKKVVVGGTSAGCAIQGSHYFAALHGTIRSEDALQNPLSQGVTVGNDDFLFHALLKNTITDTHYNNPDRKGRQMVFLARMVQGKANPAKGIGIEEKTAVLIEPDGTAKVVGNSNAYFLISNEKVPEVLQFSTPMTWNSDGKAVKVYSVKAAREEKEAETFDLSTWQLRSGKKWSFFSVQKGELKITE